MRTPNLVSLFIRKYKKILYLNVATTLIIPVGVNASTSPFLVKDKTKTYVTCVGDSITDGTGSTGWDNHNNPPYAYPSQLGTLLGNNYVVYNYGDFGRCMSSNMPYCQTYIFDSIGWKPSSNSGNDDSPNFFLSAVRLQSMQHGIVVIQLGTNDAYLSEAWNASGKDAFVSSYKLMINTFLAAGASQIFVNLPPPTYESNERPAMIEEDIIPAIEDVVAGFKNESGSGNAEKVILVDVHTPLTNKEELFPDKIHPNDEGASIMANTVYNAMRSNLGKKK